jgi:hypothetical protein
MRVTPWRAAPRSKPSATTFGTRRFPRLRSTSTRTSDSELPRWPRRLQDRSRPMCSATEREESCAAFRWVVGRSCCCSCRLLPSESGARSTTRNCVIARTRGELRNTHSGVIGRSTVQDSRRSPLRPASAARSYEPDPPNWRRPAKTSGSPVLRPPGGRPLKIRRKTSRATRSRISRALI